MKPFLFILAAAAGLAWPLGAPSASETNVAVGSQNVDYAGLNPGSDVGADRLLRRIRRAAEFSCGVQPSQRAAQQSCVQYAVSHAVERVGSTVVSARYHRDALESAYEIPLA